MHKFWIGITKIVKTVIFPKRVKSLTDHRLYVVSNIFKIFLKQKELDKLIH